MANVNTDFSRNNVNERQSPWRVIRHKATELAESIQYKLNEVEQVFFKSFPIQRYLPRHYSIHQLSCVQSFFTFICHGLGGYIALEVST